MNTRRVPLLFGFLTLVVCSSVGQVATGTPPFSSAGGGSFDTINLGNLNIHVGVPILSKAGRGLPLSYAMSYDSSVWYPSGNAWTPVSNWGWRGITEAAVGYVTYNVKPQSTFCGSPPTRTNVNYYSNWVYHDPSGTAHPMGIVFHEDCDTDMGSGSGTASDGSGYTMTASGNAGVGSATVYTTSGTVLNPPMQVPTGSGTVTDANGNRFTVTLAGSTTTVYDTLSSSAAALTVIGSPTPSQITYPGPNSSNSTTILTYTTQYGIKTNFNCSNIAEYTSPSTVSLLTTIQLPDGSQYHFQYEDTLPVGGNYKTGRISSLQLPTGATISYTYPGDGIHNPIVCSDGSTPSLNRVTPDSATAWQYVRTPPQSGTNWLTTVTPPDSNVTTLNFQYSAPNYYETKRVVKGGSTTLQTIQTCYNNAAPDCSGTTITPPISRRDVYVQLPDNTGKTSKASILYDGYGHVTEVDNYDFGGIGSGSPGGLLRQVLTTYSTLPSNSLGTTIVEPSQTTVKDGSGVVKAQTTFTYDQGTPTTTTGTPQHIGVTGSRGNLTRTTSLVQGTTTLAKSATFYDTGGVNTTTDVNGAVSTYTFSNSTASCGYSFPTNVAEPMGLTRSMTWDCTGAVQTGVTDENGKISSVTFYDSSKSPTFDPLWRPIYSTDATGVQTTYAYTATTADSRMLFNGSNSAVENLVTLDSLGRAHLAQRRKGPSSIYYDSVETDYDTLGRVYKSTMPYTGTASQAATNPVVTTTTYDGANRIAQVLDGGSGYIAYDYATNAKYNDVLVTSGPNPAGEQTKKRQLEYDGAGRLTSVCELSSTLPGSATCGQSQTHTGFWTKYTYDALGDVLTVAQNAQATSQPRTYVYDGLGRMTSETNPESGTTTYVYDTTTFADTCGSIGRTSLGDLVQRKDANGIVTCSLYDSLHRVTDVGNTSGNGTSNPCKRFRYDNSNGVTGTRPTGVTITNSLGRIVEAETDNCGAWPPTPISDEWFSYSARGELTDVYESTPHSGGYYHTTTSYFENGALKTLGGIPGQTVFTYGVDSEGRPSTAVQGSTTLVSATTFNTASQPLTVTLGLGDSDSYGYDANTGRMTSYTFTVGSTPKSTTGNLTWNPNGTLSKLAITDGFNSGGTQTCKYGDPASSVPGYDDLGRLIKVDCGASIWQQNFSFDAFGNLIKTVPTGGTGIAWNPGYAPATNRYNLGGTSYDANGNLLTDTFHTYAWDVYGHPASIDSSACGTNGTCLTYDALGNMVEKNVAGTFSQVLYSPVGKLATMNGQTLVNAYVPLPGGQTFNIASGTGRFWHKDWLGTVRLASQRATRVADYDSAFAPFGEAYKNFGSTASIDFTGDTQDTIAGTYDTPNRELNPNQGRWISPDPAGLRAVRLADPQTWNRYAYVRNSPNHLIDPSGLFMSLGPFPEEGGSDFEDNYVSDWDLCASYGLCGGDPTVDPGDPRKPDDSPDKKKPTNCTPGTPGCSNLPAKPQACQGVTPDQFDYTTPQIYMGDNGEPVVQSAQQHITQGHIYPGKGSSNWNEPNTMYFVSPWPDFPRTDGIFQQVKEYNAKTFFYGEASQPGGKGNITFTLTMGPTWNQYWNLPGFIGYYIDPIMPEAIPLINNKLVLMGNCTTPRSSYPTF